MATVARKAPAGVGPGNQVGRPHQVDEPLVADPPPAPNQLVAHHRRVGGRPTERDRPKLQEQQRHLPDRPALWPEQTTLSTDASRRVLTGAELSPPR